MQSLKILIVDDFEPWAHFVETIISAESHHEVVAVTSNGYTALLEAERLKPHVALLDVNLPGMNGIDLARSLRRIKFPPFVLCVSQNRTAAVVRAAFEAGVGGYVLKTDVNRELITAIKSVTSGERFLSASLRDLMSNL